MKSGKQPLTEQEKEALEQGLIYWQPIFQGPTLLRKPGKVDIDKWRRRAGSKREAANRASPQLLFLNMAAMVPGQVVWKSQKT